MSVVSIGHGETTAYKREDQTSTRESREDYRNYPVDLILCCPAIHEQPNGEKRNPKDDGKQSISETLSDVRCF
jgi:triosephosphate isomerase